MKPAYLLHPIFIVGLLALLLNDHFLKDYYGNWWTGKLSDVVGIMILPLFLKFLFPVSNRSAIVTTILFFLFWKSTFSQGCIDTFNSLTTYSIGRVVDYTDYMAFLVLPLTYWTMKNIKHHQDTWRHHQQWAYLFLFPLTLLAFVATSEEDEDDYLPEDPSIESCCDTGVIEVAVGNGKIFIPSIFTPDGNGVNDYFYVSVDSNILRLDTFLIYSSNPFDTLYYEVNVTDFSPDNGFDGIVSDTIVAAKYGYILFVTSKDSVTRVVTNTVCCIPCVEPLGVDRPVGIEACGFSSQHNFETGYDFSAESGEPLDCFEN